MRQLTHRAKAIFCSPEALQWLAAMAAMTWDRFLDAYPRPHLIVAWLHGGPASR